MSIIFKDILIIAKQKQNKASVYKIINQLITFFPKKKCNVFLEEETAKWTKISNIPTLPEDNYHHHIDLLVVIGGDGSILRAAPTAIKNRIPVLGINQGRLGFLADVTPKELENKLHDILLGEYTLEERFLLKTSYANTTTDSSCSALNEVVITHAKPLTQMIEFLVYVNDQLISSHRADGLIVSTPTGSTAYALSAGGPILHPSLNAISLTPMFPHTLSARPIVVDGNSTISISLENKGTKACVSCDSMPPTVIEHGEILTIKKQRKKLTLIHPLSYNYYETLRSKLNWHKKH